MDVHNQILQEHDDITDVHQAPVRLEQMAGLWHQQLEDLIIISRARQLTESEPVSLSVILLISKEAKAVLYYVGLRLLIMKSGIAWMMECGEGGKTQ